MKKNLLLCFTAALFTLHSFATNFNVTISGFAYTNNDLIVNVGDVVTIEAAPLHPLVQVSQATWNANGSTPLPGGFSSTTNFVLTITAAMAGTTIYYVCSNHVLSSGMKGKITVNLAASVRENSVRDFNFTVFPNPVTADSWINISTKKAGKISVTVFDMQGKIIKQMVNTNLLAGEINLRFDAALLQKGNYVVMMRTTEGIMRKQILVQ